MHSVFSSVEDMQKLRNEQQITFIASQNAFCFKGKGNAKECTSAVRGFVARRHDVAFADLIHLAERLHQTYIFMVNKLDCIYVN